MVDYEFYRTVYIGGAIPDERVFLSLSQRAEEQLRRYREIYTVCSSGEESEAMAVCAMADALYTFQQLQSGGVVASSSIGSVSTSYRAPEVDTSQQAQERELYRRACLYLDICRGCC